MALHSFFWRLYVLLSLSTRKAATEERFVFLYLAESESDVGFSHFDLSVEKSGIFPSAGCGRGVGYLPRHDV